MSKHGTTLPAPAPIEEQIEEKPERPRRLTPPAEAEPLVINPLAVTPASLAPRAGDLATHLRSPLSIGASGEAGIALLVKRFTLVPSLGTFQGIPIKFPVGSMLLSIYLSIVTPFNGTTPSVSIGKTSNSGEFASLVSLTQAAGIYKTDVTAILQPSNIAYLSAILTAATVGEAYIAMVYSGAPLKVWQ